MNENIFKFNFYAIIDLTDDGWETVRRSRSKTSPVSKASTSSKGSIGSNSNGKFQKPSSTNNLENLRSNGLNRNQGKNTPGGPSGKRQKHQPYGTASRKKGAKESNGSSYRDVVVKTTSDRHPE